MQLSLWRLFRSLGQSLGLAWLVVFLVWLSPGRSSFENALQQLLVPIWSGLSASGRVLRPWMSSTQTARDQLYLAQILEAKYAQEFQALVELDQLRRENQELRLALELHGRNKNVTGIVTEPLAGLTQPLVAAGSAEGVLPGMLVLSQNTLLGFVETVASQVSQVQLLTQNREQAVIGVTQTGVKGVVQGDGGRLLFTQVPQTKVLQLGDRITSSGQPGIRPGLLLGVIGSFDNSPTAGVQTAVLDQLVDFYTLPIVTVGE